MYTKLALSTLTLVAALSVAACQTTTDTKKATPPPKPAASKTVTAAATTAPAATLQLSDGTYSGPLLGKTATLTIRGGQPDVYTWGNDYTNRNVYLDENTVVVNQGRLRISSASANAINGKWTLGRNRGRVTLTRQ